MSDLIDRESAIVRACAVIKDDGVAYDVLQALKAIPSAQPINNGSTKSDRSSQLTELLSAQQLSCDGCRHDGMWDDELEEGYDCPCARCIRNVRDNYEA